MHVCFTRLTLNNIALFVQQTLPLHPGLTCLLGETGSGKSLLLDALAWVLGATGSAKEVLRHGTTSGQVELEFSLSALSGETSNALHAWLTEQGLPDLVSEFETVSNSNTPLHWVLSREWSTTSSRFRLQGTLLARPAVEQLSQWLWVPQGQHATVALFEPMVQLQTLDTYGNIEHQQLKQQANQAIEQWQTLTLQQSRQQQQQQQWQAELAQVEAELSDLEAAQLQTPDEAELLKTTIRCYSQSEALQKGLGLALTLLQGQASIENWDEEGNPTPQRSVLEGLQQALKALNGLIQILPALQSEHQTLEGFESQLKDVIYTLETHLEQSGNNPKALEEAQYRLSFLEKLQRRYSKSLPELFAHHEQLADRCISLQAQLETLQTIEADLENAFKQAQALIQALTSSREVLAKTLSQQVQKHLSQLAMPHAHFNIAITPSPHWRQHYAANEVTFLLSANPGEPLKPLSKVASGGELARIVLALQLATLQPSSSSPSLHTQHLPVFMFDEIDSGTSGQAAKAIAQQLKHLATLGCQVFTVTHQPLVAAYAHHCLWVEKRVETVNNQPASIATAHYTQTETERMNLLSLLATGETEEHQFAQRLLLEARR